MAETALPALQLWLQNAIVAGRATDPAARFVAGDSRMSADERVAVYARAYRARLIDCLRGEYPALRLLVGDTVFDLFASSYLAACPPAHFSLYELGARFAGHLDSTRPREEGIADDSTALPAALARLERTRTQVQRAQGVERSLAPPPSGDSALLPGMRLRLPDSARLMRLDFDFLPLFEAAETGGPAVVPQARRALVAVTRSHYRVRVIELEPCRFAWLEALAGGIEDVQAAAGAAAGTTGGDAGALLADLALWIPAAAALGLVVTA